MMLREIRYGIEVDINSVKIQPFPILSKDSFFHYKFGFVDVYYSSTLVTLKIRGCETEYERKYEIYNLLSNTLYYIEEICPNNNFIHPLFTNNKVFSNRGNLIAKNINNNTINNKENKVFATGIKTDDNGLLLFFHKVNNNCTIKIYN